MTLLYAESSAVLRWLLNEPDPDGVARELRQASRVLASELTMLECRRMLVRLVTAGTIGPLSADRRRGDLERLAQDWDLWPIDSAVLSRASESWPKEPVQSLDSIHLATLSLARGAVPDIKCLSLDLRVRENVAAMGVSLIPGQGPAS